MTTELQFTVDSALLRELGEKLVETVHIALAELVKNSYDADATEVNVIFEKNIEGRNIIKIVDNGTGMSFNAVQNYWMRIATANKDKKNVSDVFGRYLTGAKGIGRFSCRRLGSKLRLITKGTLNGKKIGIQPEIQMTEVIFPWLNFEAGKDVTKIICEGKQSIKSNEFTGTTLIIEGISDEWSKRGYDWLKRHLAVLAANRGAKRKGFMKDPGFNVTLVAPNFEGGVRDLRDDLINAGWGTLKAHINDKNQAVCELNALGIGRKSIISSEIFSNLEDISLKIGIMVFDKKQMRDVSILSKKSLNDILPEWGGVQIRYRGFRVFPYGDDDWLDIDFDRGLRKGSPKNELLVFAESLRGVDADRSLLNMLSMRSYVGNVEIGNSVEGFEMKASREGFLKSDAITELKKFVRFAIDWSTVLRDFYLRQEFQREAEKVKREFENIIGEEIETKRTVESALEYIDSEIKTVARNLTPDKRRVVEKTLGLATEVIRKHNESTRVELSHLRLIASTSTLLLIFSHEVKSLLGLLEQSKNSLNIIARELTGQNKKSVLSIGNKFTDLNNRLEQLLKMTSLITEDKTKVKPGRVALKSKLSKVKEVFELILDKYDIELDFNSVPNNIVIKKILEAELYSILLNVLSNSIKAVIAGGKIKKIKISAIPQNGSVLIHICDTGIGLSPNIYKDVFTPFVSDPEGKLYINLEKRLNPEDSMIVGNGSGLGLGIVKEIVDAHGGTIQFIEPENEWSTELKIELL